MTQKRIELENKILAYLGKDVKDVGTDIKNGIRGGYQTLKESLPQIPEYIQNKMPANFHELCENSWGPLVATGSAVGFGLVGAVIYRMVTGDNLPLDINPAFAKTLYSAAGVQLTGLALHAGEVLSRPIPQKNN